MCLGLATKGIICTSITAGYPVYTPVEEPELKTTEKARSDIRIKEFKPRIKIEVQEG